MLDTSEKFTTATRSLVLRALKYPRGRYDVERAHQLSAIPVSTLHNWATSDTLMPDWFHSKPRGWSYRDIVYARLLAWLRSKHMDRLQASQRVNFMRKLLENSEIDPNIHSDGTIFLIGAESTDRFTGQQAFDGLVEMLDVFQLTEPITGVSKSKL